MVTKQSGRGSPENNCPGKNMISRREFARRAVLATASSAAIPAALLGDISDSPGRAEQDILQNTRENARQNFPQNADPTSHASANEIEVENKFESILSQYGSRFSEEQKADIRRLVGETQRQLDRLRAFSLDNSDQPATVLKPLMERAARAPGRAPASAKPVKRRK